MTVTTIEFCIGRDDDDDDNDDSKCSGCIRLASPAHDIEAMDAANEVVIPESSVRVLYRYPLRKHFVGHYQQQHRGGFTRADIVRIIGDEYQRIYLEEATTSEIRARLIPGTLNRNETNGKHGIWGHTLEDLCLHTIWYDSSTQMCHLGIDS